MIRCETALNTIKTWLKSSQTLLRKTKTRLRGSRKSTKSRREVESRHSMKWALRQSSARSTSRRSRVAWQRWEAAGAVALSSRARRVADAEAVVDKSVAEAESQTDLHREVLAAAPGMTHRTSRVWPLTLQVQEANNSQA